MWCLLSSWRASGRRSAGSLKAQELWPNFFLCAFVEPWLYTGAGSGPWGRLNLATGHVDRFDSLRADNFPFGPDCITPLGDGNRLLVADQYGMWVLKFPNGEKENVPAKISR
jgi:hypothetical protein